MKFLFLFLDGIGFGQDNPEINPFASVEMPALDSLLSGQHLIEGTPPLESDRATLLALDACLEISGMPQSATGQAALLTGINVPGALGYHYGPKPNPAVAEFVSNGNLFSTLNHSGKQVAFLNAYPQTYFDNIQSGRRMYSAIPLAAASAGIPLRTEEDLIRGQAISADFTAQGWHQHLNRTKVPILTPLEAGERLALLSDQYDFSFFEFWLSDYAGHRQDMRLAKNLLLTFDQVLSGLINHWDLSENLILITSDHGNLEDLSTRRHTQNPVPALLIGPSTLREEFAQNLKDLTQIAPAIIQALS